MLLPSFPYLPFAAGDRTSAEEVGCCQMNLVVVLDGRGAGDSQLHGAKEVQGDDQGCMGGHDR